MYYLCFENGRDGLGAQVINIFHGYLLSKYLNINFYYEPMSRIGHNYENDKNFEDELNNFLNFGKLKQKINFDKKIEIFKNDELKKINFNEEKTENILIIMKKRSTTLNNDYPFLKNINFTELSSLFLKNKINPFPKNQTNICIHIRSGDIYFSRRELKKRFIPVNKYKELINILRKKFKDKNYLIHLFFESKTNLGFGNTDIHKINENIFNINELLGDNIVLHENENILDDYLKFVYCDYLFVGNSCFSISSAFFNKNKVIYCFNDILRFSFDTFDKIINTNLIELEKFYL